MRDLRAQTTTLVSRASGATGADGNGDSDQPAISADGRFVAFTSSATNLHPDDTDTSGDVFRDVLGPPPVAPPPAPQPPAAQPPPAQPGCPLAGFVIVGSDGDDERDGGPLSDVMFGALGDDRLRGLAGADCLYGQGGDDRLLGARGRDRLLGDGGGDRLHGGPRPRPAARPRVRGGQHARQDRLRARPPRRRDRRRARHHPQLREGQAPPALVTRRRA